MTFASVLAKMARRGQITAAQQQQANAAFNAALATERSLSGTRRTELAAVTTTAHDLAATGRLWPSRLAMVDATLDANRQRWAHGTLLGYGQRVMFAGSELEWEVLPGPGDPAAGARQRSEPRTACGRPARTPSSRSCCPR